MAAARSLLKAPATCRHCGGAAALEDVGEDLAAHVCPGGYVTRIIRYGRQLDQEEFAKSIQELVREMGTVEGGDVRIASRYAWDLGLTSESNGFVLKEAYWTQSYRRTKNDSPDRPALFLCSNRDSFFVQPLSGTERLCPKCRE